MVNELFIGFLESFIFCFTKKNSWVFIQLPERPENLSFSHLLSFLGFSDVLDIAHLGGLLIELLTYFFWTKFHFYLKITFLPNCVQSVKRWLMSVNVHMLFLLSFLITVLIIFIDLFCLLTYSYSLYWVVPKLILNE